MRNLFFLFIFCLSLQVSAQKQLVLLKKQKVILRLNPGDDFIYSLKGVKGVHKSYVNNLYDTAVVAHQTIVPFHKIDRIYFKRHSFANVIGGLLVIGGAGIFVIDQFNSVVVHGEKPSLDDRVTTITITGLVVGLPMMLIHKKSQKMKPSYHLLTVKKGSVFYTEPPQQMIIENK
ncbi:MAG: hypothetical protein ABI663_11865 [Chryseolinea sp.]